jgi:hypothetical protein
VCYPWINQLLTGYKHSVRICCCLCCCCFCFCCCNCCCCCCPFFFSYYNALEWSECSVVPVNGCRVCESAEMGRRHWQATGCETRHGCVNAAQQTLRILNQTR